VRYIRAGSWREALRVRADRPDAVALCGGTDVMVELNRRRDRPALLLDLSGVPDIAGWRRVHGGLRIGAGMTLSRIVAELAVPLPGLARAARSVGSRQVRNRATLGGSLGTAAPAGDAHPALLAVGAVIELGSLRGTRMVPAGEFYLGPRRTALAADELIAAVHLPVATGPQWFAKVGGRNGVVVAVCSFALALWPDAGVGTGIGAAGPTPRRAPAAEELIAGELSGRWRRPAALPAALVERFGALVASAAEPVDDLRAPAAYRRHAAAVLARRALTQAWQDHIAQRGYGSCG
jgi:CO/xanthine dehydrogenase FAD-binding subunit